MVKIIVNADDCGLNVDVNRHIEQAIINKKISSTTIMANMDDFRGAVELYNKYKQNISFGFHLNLFEGQPLLSSSMLLESGFLKELDGKVVFNGNAFRRKFLSKEIREAIYDEVIAQATKIKEAGIEISHIDSHHFLHNAFFMIPLLPRLCRDLNVYKVRNYRNYMPWGISKVARNSWSRIIKLQCDKVQFTNYFCSFEEFYNSCSLDNKFYSTEDSIELMCHPGGIYTNEEFLLLNNNIEEIAGAKLFNYNTISL